MASYPIVQINASVQQAPTPNTLQQTGALISQGGTTTAPGTLTLVPTLAALTALLAPGNAVTSLTWSGSVVTVTTTAPHGWTSGDVVPVVISGATPAAYNGTFTGTITGASTLTYPLASNPGSETVPGTVSLGAVPELLAMGTTYFAGNGVPAVNVLELGEADVAANIAELTTFIANVDGSPQQQYGFLVPREWDNQTSFLTLCNNNTAVDAQLYFWVTTTLANRAVYSTPGYKCVYAEVEATGIPAT